MPARNLAGNQMIGSLPERIRISMRRFQRIARKSTRPTALPMIADPIIFLHPGDVAILQTHEELPSKTIERIHEAWRERVGKDVRLIVLQGDYKLSVLRLGEG